MISSPSADRPAGAAATVLPASSDVPAMDPGTSIPTVVGLISVSSETVSLSAGVAVQVKSPAVAPAPIKRLIALTSPQPLTCPVASGLGPAMPVASAIAKT